MVVAIAGAQGRQPQGSALRLLVPQVTRGFHTMVTGNYGAAAPIILDMRYAVALGSQVILMPGGTRQICNQLQIWCWHGWGASPYGPCQMADRLDVSALVDGNQRLRVSAATSIPERASSLGGRTQSAER